MVGQVENCVAKMEDYQKIEEQRERQKVAELAAQEQAVKEELAALERMLTSNNGAAGLNE